MNDIARKIALRDVGEENGKKFLELLENQDINVPEIEQIRNGYTNVNVISFILNCRAQELMK